MQAKVFSQPAVFHALHVYDKHTFYNLLSCMIFKCHIPSFGPYFANFFSNILVEFRVLMSPFSVF